MTTNTKRALIAFILLIVAITTIISFSNSNKDKQQTTVEQTSIEQGTHEDFVDFVGPDGNVVYFGYDLAKLSESEIKKLDIQIGWIKLNPESSITIEGHCDSRGKNAYNQKLGLLRADMVKKYLVDNGVVNPIFTYSLGEESPKYQNCEMDDITTEDKEECHSGNRRAETVIKIGE